MSSTTGTEIGELKDLILGLERNLDKKIDNLDRKVEIGFTQVQGEFKRLDERINSVEKQIEESNKRFDERITSVENQIEIQINDVKERLNDNNKMTESTNNRLNSITIGFFGIIGVLVTGLLTFVGKLVFFPSNPIS